jgi:chemosensory pili system protein ChpA (sensor histidine kinase/response regulator)
VLSESATEFDLGPLSWVQGEIDEALTRGTEALAAYRSNPADAVLLKRARTHVHQAAGAIQMVGLDAVVAFTDEIERQLVRMEELPASGIPGVVTLVDNAVSRLRVFLDGVANGAPPVPLTLFGEYEAMQRSRGVEAPAPTDLFYPDLGVRAPRAPHAEIMPAARLASHLLKERRQYQRGLLEWLRGADAGAAAMRESIVAIEDLTTQPNLRAFWWTAAALLDALHTGGLERSFGAKQLVARIDMQIRRVTEGSAKVADRLRREVLYYVATSKPSTPTVEAVQRAYNLAALIPTPEALDADVVRRQPLLREARDQLASAKDAWLKAASGRTDTLPKLAQMLATADAKAAEVRHPALSKLTSGLAARLADMPATGVSEPLAMEFATALLLAESAFENFNNLSPEFGHQVDEMLKRLDAARAGQSESAARAPVLDEMSRRAQERALLAQVMREVRANLRHIEQVLDAFFRDHTRRSELASLAKDSQQIRGALRILELDDADRLLELCQAQIERYANPDTPVDEDGLELLAESLSGLGFYVDAVLHQRPDRERIIAPLIAKRLGEAPPPKPAEPQSVEDSVAELRGALPRLMADVRDAPADAAVRSELRGKLASLRDDADLIGDSELVAQASAALKEIDGGGESEALAASVDLIVEAGAAPAPAISEETQRLLQTDASALDAELLDIYLTEADEVLGTVDEQRAVLEHNPGDREAVVNVRRQFHTLKGSGRMVGLTELGELARDVERTLNRLLEEDRRVTPAVVALIGVACTSFRHWVGELRTAGRFATDPAALKAALRAVEAEWPGGATAMPLPPVPVVKPSVPVSDTPIGPVKMPTRAPATPADADAGFAPFATELETPIVYPPPVADVHRLSATPFDALPGDAGVVPDLELVDFPELGAPLGEGMSPTVTVLEQSVDETIDVGLPAELREAAKPVLRVVADNRVAHPGATDARARHAHGPGLTLLTDAARGRDASVAPDAEEVTVGPVTLSASLWRILCDEVDQNVAVLQHEVSIMQFDPDHMPVVAMVRASHTLCGIHRTGGIALIATTAGALEQALLALEERGAPFPSTAQPVLARATAGLAHFVSRVKQREGFTPSDEREAADIAAELDEMRRDALADLPVADPLMAPEGDTDRVEPEPLYPDVSPSTPLLGSSELRSVPQHFGSSDDDVFASATAEAGAPAMAGKPPAAPDAEAMLLVQWQPAAGAAADTRTATADDDGAAGPAPSAERAGAPTDFVADSRSDAGATAAAPLAEPFVEYPPLAGHVIEPAKPAVPLRDSRAHDAPPVLEQPWPDAPPAAAPAAREVATDESLLDVADDLDETILAIFVEEANELFPQAAEQVRTWRRAPDDAATAAQLRRTLHTLKGSARMAGAMRLGELAHRMEARLTIGDAPVAPSADLFEALDSDLDRIGFVLDALREGKGSVALPWIVQQPAPAAPAERTVTPTPSGETAYASIAAPAAVVDAAAPSAAAGHADLDMAKAMLRVRADIVDQLVNEAGEVAIARARVESELRTLKANLLELTGSVIRLRSQVREIELQAETQIQSRMSLVSSSQEEFDPLELDRYTRFQELTRSFAEGVNDVSTVQQALLKNLDDADAALIAQARLSRDVQQRLFAIRTVPFNSLSERLYRILRKTARDLDKRVNLEIHGAQTELDRSVLEKLVGPLEHLLRNALDHGIETREARLAAGKSETGEIELTVRQVGNEITIELVDDGRGIDFESVRERAVAVGLLPADSEPTIHQLVECLFRPGFTTASAVTQLSGRGIGMDVVRSEVVALGGRVDIHTQPGKGTRFNLFLPLTLAVAQAVLVRAGGRMWAIPAPMVEQVQQIKADVLRTLYVDGQVHWQSRPWPFHYLPRLLGDTSSIPEIARYNAVLLIRSGQGTAAVHVDEMLGNQEIVVKNIGPQLARVPGISGATVLGTGEIVLIVNPVQLAQRPGVVRYDPAHDERLLDERRRAAASSARKLVMVVDDSLTVRKFTTRLLTREGFEVVTARDGIEALKLLGERRPDAILLDIEMPRMDGFEFAKSIKGDDATAQIPIIMITSRTAEKHRNRAAELGVEQFLGKPYQEQELLRTLRGVIEEADALVR